MSTPINASDEIYKAVAALLQRQTKCFTAAQLVQRFASVPTDARFQYDPVARHIVAAIEKVAVSDPGHIISAEQISQFYNELESLNPNSEFKSANPDVFQVEEAPLTPPLTTLPNDMRNRDNYSEIDRLPGDDQNLIVDEFEDPAAAAYQAPEFAVAASFRPEQYRFAEHGTTQELQQFGASNIRLTHKTDAPNLMVYVATFVTPTGKHSVLVPVQVADQPINLPQVFANLDGSMAYPFNKQGFDAFERDNIQVMSVKASSAADSLRDNESDSASRAPTALETFMNAPDAEPATKVAGLEDVESILINAVARKSSRYAARTIDTASQVLTKELRNLSQYENVVFSGDASNGDLLYRAKLTSNRRASEVVIPVEVKSGNVLYPTVFAATDGTVYPLSKDGIANYFSQKPVTVSSVSTGDLTKANYQTLRQTIYAACISKDYDKANEALEVIASKFGQDYYAKAMTDYTDWQKSTASLTPVQVKAGIQNDYGRKMSNDDWANLIQAEINTVTGGKEVKANTTGMSIEFDKLSDEHFEGVISTSRIDHIELT